MKARVLAYLVRRVVSMLLLLVVISVAIFMIFFMVPKLSGADPAAAYVGRGATAEAVEGARRKLGFDQPIPVQYGRFVKGVFLGRSYSDGADTVHCSAPCFGYSFRTEEEVWPKIVDRLPVTASLACGAAVLWLVGGVLTGIVSAVRRRSLWDRAAMVVTLAGVSLPIYFTGLLALMLFSYTIPLFPNVEYVPFLRNPSLWAQNLVLPWVTLAFLYAAQYARLTRAAMLEVMSEDYIRTARAKGLAEPVVIRKHAFRAVLTPIVTIFGLDLGSLLGGAVLTESTYSFPGLGKMAVDAVAAQDLPVILGVTLVAAFFIVFANLVVDLLYAVVDPRVRLA